MYVSDYEWYVELVGKGLAQREKFPMPPSVTTPKRSTESWRPLPSTLSAFGLSSTEWHKLSETSIPSKTN